MNPKDGFGDRLRTCWQTSPELAAELLLDETLKICHRLGLTESKWSGLESAGTIASDVTMAILKRGPDVLDGSAAMRTFVYTCVMHKMSDGYRKERRAMKCRVLLPDDFEAAGDGRQSGPVDVVNPEALLLEADRRARLRATVRTLPRRDQDALGMATSDYGRRYGCCQRKAQKDRNKVIATIRRLLASETRPAQIRGADRSVGGKPLQTTSPGITTRTRLTMRLRPRQIFRPPVAMRSAPPPAYMPEPGATHKLVHYLP